MSRLTPGVIRVLRFSICVAALLASFLAVFERRAAAQPTPCNPDAHGGDSTDWLPDDDALQYCLTAGGVVELTAGFPGYIVDGKPLPGDSDPAHSHWKGLRLASADTTLRTVNSPSEDGITTFTRARILAGRHLFDQILRTTPITGTANFTIRYVEFHGMVDQYCNGDLDLEDENNSLIDCDNYPQDAELDEEWDEGKTFWRVRRNDCADPLNPLNPDNSHPGNLHLQAPLNSSFTFDNNQSVEALCGSGLGLHGKDFSVRYNYVSRNGRSEYEGEGTRWSDGITALWCDGGTIAHNVLVDNTDIGLAVWSSSECEVAENTIANLGKYGFAGLNLGNSPGAPNENQIGKHTDSKFHNNEIYSLAEDNGRLAMGILIGTHPWFVEEANPRIASGGEVYENHVYDNVINLVIEGATAGDETLPNGNVHDNNIGPVFGTNGLGSCETSDVKFAVNTSDVDAEVYAHQEGWEDLEYHEKRCSSSKIFNDWHDDEGYEWSERTAIVETPGGFDTLRFFGTAGQRVRLEATDGTFAYGRIEIHKPDDSFLAGAWVTTQGFIETLTLPVTGTYKVIVDPEGDDVGNITLKLIRLPEAQVSTVSHKFATSWVVPSGSGSSVAMSGGATMAARKSSSPDMPRSGLRLGVQASAGTVDFLTNGPYFSGNNLNQPKQGGIFLEFEIERYPSSSDAEILGTDGGGTGSSTTDDLRAYITPAGQLVIKHDGGRVTPITVWTSPTLGLYARHTLELRFEYNAESTHPSPNPVWENFTSWLEVYFDGSLVSNYGAEVPEEPWNSNETSPKGLDLTNGLNYLVNTKIKSPAATNGLLMNVFKSGLTAATNHGDALDVYNADTWRTTLLEAADAGTYSQWTGGQPDWRARSIIAGDGAFVHVVSTNVLGNKISYRMESMASKGITGHIGSVLVGVRMTAVSSATKAFIRRNGVDTELTDLLLGNSDTRWYRVAISGWSPTDVIEVGVTCGANATNSLNAVALIVEHDSPEPAPITDATTEVMTRTYTGNGSAQTIDFGNGLLPTALLVMPVNSSGVEPIWWWESRQGAAGMSLSMTSFSRIWPQKGSIHVVHTTSKSYNANGVSYVAIALFDPTSRYVIPFAVSKPLAEDNYTHHLRNPQSGVLASGFTPDFIFGGAAFGSTQDATKASLYRGPGHSGDLTAKLGGDTASDADRIQSLGSGTVQFGTLIGHGSGDHAFWAGRVSDGVSSTRLMAVTSYVGDGTSSRNISLSLSGSTPVFALVVPTNATAKVYRVTGDSAGRRTDSGNSVTSSISALGANQITVGTALNTSGVTYDVWVITTGTINP